MWQPLHEEVPQPRWQMSNREDSTRLELEQKSGQKLITKEARRGQERPTEQLNYLCRKTIGTHNWIFGLSEPNNTRVQRRKMRGDLCKHVIWKKL